MEYFREAIKSAEGIKGKTKPPLGEYIRMSKVGAQGDTIIFTQSKKLRAFRQLSVFCYRAATLLGFQVLGC